MRASDPIGRDGVGAILRLAWPIIISRSTQAVIGLADAIFVAHLGESSLAATSTGAFNTSALLILPMGIAFIVSSFSSQLTGAGDPRGARKYGYYGLVIAAATQVAALAALPFVAAALAQLPYSPELHGLMTDYLRWRLPSAGAAIGIEALSNYYGGLGRTALPMRVSVLAMALNVPLCWLLIDGHFGAPALGVRGAAIANLIATVVAFGVFLGIFIREARALPGVAATLRVSELFRMLRFGIPSGLNWFFEFLAFNFFVNVVVAGLGTTALAAMMSVLQLNSVSFMPAFGLASAGAILVGQALGAGEASRVPRIVLRTFGVMACWQVAVGFAYLCVPQQVLAPFRPSGDATAFLLAAQRILMLSVAWQIFDAVATALAEALRAAGDTSFTLWARLAIAWVFFVPGSWFTVRRLHWGDAGAISWLVFYLAALAAVLLVRFRGGQWRSIELLEPSVL